MASPSSEHWRQYSLIAAVSVAAVVLIGFIAEASGLIEVHLPGSDGPTAEAGGASPADIVTTGGTETTEPPSPDDSTASVPDPSGTWATVYEDQTLYLDTFLSGTDACSVLSFDLDTLDDGGDISLESSWNPIAADDLDLLWDSCAGFEQGEVYLTSGDTSFGDLYVAGTEWDPQSCHDEIASFPLPMDRVIDPALANPSWFEEGQQLCLLTNEQHIVLGELVSVGSTPDDPPYLQATFSLTLWSLD